MTPCAATSVSSASLRRSIPVGALFARPPTKKPPAASATASTPARSRRSTVRSARAPSPPERPWPAWMPRSPAHRDPNPQVGARGIHHAIVTALGGVPRFHHATLIPQAAEHLAAQWPSQAACRSRRSTRPTCCPTTSWKRSGCRPAPSSTRQALAILLTGQPELRTSIRLGAPQPWTSGSGQIRDGGDDTRRNQRAPAASRQARPPVRHSVLPTTPPR